uniref:Fucosyltransferase n=1 Tax=Phallusia mammillata TaxID=59560 RepID=A0A6F9DDZ4_9ASCI|nr:galactoside 3(4)-L-fucosyltransferase-like [Phallusia mammillata]
MKRGKLWIVFFGLLASGVLLVVWNYQSANTWFVRGGTLTFKPWRKESSNKIINYTHQKRGFGTEMVNVTKEHHWILMWRHPWGVQTEGPRDGKDLGKCTITYDQKRLPEASAVIFHYSGLDRETMPWKHYRNPDQLFVYLTMESPSYIQIGEHRRTMSKFDGGFINWTMSYRHSSDIFSSYFTSANTIFENGKQKVEDLLAKKSRTGLWVVSNCKLLPGSRMRYRYIEDLIQAGLPIDRYGACFRNKKEFAALSPEVLHSYRFYFSFENALHCEDYMTEKLWINGIQSGRVPVIWGPLKADVEKLAPPGSFIHTEDFKSPAELAQYLLRLEKNETEYRRFFDWRVNPDERTKKIVAQHYLIREEQLCDKLQRPFSRKYVESISDWFFGNETKECLQN